MAWFKVDDQLHDHKKVRRLAPKDRAPAMGLWVLCGAWAAQNLSDGFVPREVTERYDNRKRLASELVRVGFWHEAEQDGEQGYRFHDWGDHQPTAKEVQARRDAARQRMRRVRENRASGSEDVRANKESTSQEVRLTPTRPDPTRSSSSSNSSTRTAVSAVLGLDEDDDETTTIIDFIREVHRPTALGPYVRTLIGHGDLPDIRDQARQWAAGEPQAPPPENTTQIATHPFVDQGFGECTSCPLPDEHPVHRHLRAVGEPA